MLTTLAEYILPASHFTLRRRGDQLADQQDVNLTRLVDLVQQAERRFDTSTRTVKGNKVTRAWKANGNGFHQPDELFADIGGLESWYIEDLVSRNKLTSKGSQMFGSVIRPRS